MGIAAILITHYNLRTIEQVKRLIVGLAHSRNRRPKAIFIGNSGDLCQTRQKRASRWDRRIDAEVSGVEACEAEPFNATPSKIAQPKSTVRSVTHHISMHSSSVAKVSSSTTPDDTPPAKTSGTIAAVQTASKSHCDDKVWYESEDYCDSLCSPHTCTE